MQNMVLKHDIHAFSHDILQLLLVPFNLPLMESGLPRGDADTVTRPDDTSSDDPRPLSDTISYSAQCVVVTPPEPPLSSRTTTTAARDERQSPTLQPLTTWLNGTGADISRDRLHRLRLVYKTTSHRQQVDVEKLKTSFQQLLTTPLF